MNTPNEKVAPTSAEKDAQDAVTKIPEPGSTPLPPGPARGNDEVMSQQQEKKS